MRIQIAYLTGDEVNYRLAQRIAQKVGVSLVCNPLGTSPTNGTKIARLHDLDHVSGEQKEAILADLLSGPTTVPVAVHSYHLGEDLMASLCASGVIVAQALKPALIRRLCAAAEAIRETGPVEEDGGAGESLVDPAKLCALVRSLALEAHKTLSRKPCASMQEFVDLCERLADLQGEIERLRQSRALQLDELGRWLESLMKRARDRAD
jgi:hypothetical protein